MHLGSCPSSEARQLLRGLKLPHLLAKLLEWNSGDSSRWLDSQFTSSVSCVVTAAAALYRWVSAARAEAPHVAALMEESGRKHPHQHQLYCDDTQSP